MARFPNPKIAVTPRTLLARAREQLSHNVLAERTGLTRTALSRYLSGQREPSLTELQRIIGATDYRLRVALRPEPREQDPIQATVLPDPMPYSVQHQELRRRLPAVLNPDDGQLPASEPDGPRLDEALLFLYELQDLLIEARAPQERFQHTYARYHRQRDRDLIHEVAVVGDGVDQAVSVMARYIDEQAPIKPTTRRRGTAAEQLPHFERLVWAHIVCCLRAEAAICTERALAQHGAMAAADARTGAEKQLEHAQWDLEHFNRTREERSLLHLKDDGKRKAVEEATAQLERSKQECARRSPHRVGCDVGRAGEAYLALELEGIAAHATHLYERLAGEPAFTAWRADYAPIDPLYDLWLDGPLSHSARPPQWFTDPQTFLERQVLWGPEWKAQIEQDRDVSPLLEAVERRVVDQFQRQWDVALVAPAPGADPRFRTEDDVLVVATCPRETTALYVLAHGVSGAAAAEAIATTPRDMAALTTALQAL